MYMCIYMYMYMYICIYMYMYMYMFTFCSSFHHGQTLIIVDWTKFLWITWAAACCSSSFSRSSLPNHPLRWAWNLTSMSCVLASTSRSRLLRILALRNIWWKKMWACKTQYHTENSMYSLNPILHALCVGIFTGMQDSIPYCTLYIKYRVYSMGLSLANLWISLHTMHVVWDWDYKYTVYSMGLSLAYLRIFLHTMHVVWAWDYKYL